MTSETQVWACHQCGDQGIRNLGVRGYCSAHLYDLFSKFDPAVFRHRGIGLQDGPLRPDYGNRYAELRCVACRAAWVGISGDACRWCARARFVMIEHQTDLLLQPPNMDRDDPRYTSAMRAWADRLATAVKSGIVEQKLADSVWRRSVHRAA